MDIDSSITTLRSTFNTGVTRTWDFRRRQLHSLLRLIEDNETDLLQAMHLDLHKSKMESMIGEIDYLKKEISHSVHYLNEWMQPEKPSKSLPNIMDTVQIEPEPFGVVLIIGAWNYPIQLVLAPLVGAIAAGNCAIIKPSELAPASCKVLAKLVPKYLDNDCYRVILGGVPETQQLLNKQFDYIFYTGSTTVGKIVYEAASKFLTPVTLELGGKSPVYLDESVGNMQIAADRIVWGKCFNAGQTCIAPDYLLCTRKVQEQFLDCAKRSLAKFYGEKIKQSADYGRIINENHFKRLVTLLENQNVVVGGSYDSQEKFIEPTIVTNVQLESDLMKSEIFGPILPIVLIETKRDVVKFVNARDKPLSFYVFSTNKETIAYLKDNVSAGGICVNDTLMHFSCDGLPFGGVGPSGIGAYHGKYSFDTFSHKKPILIKSLDVVGETLQKVRYPPYNDKNLGVLQFLLKFRPPLPTKYVCYALVFGLGALASKAVNCYLRRNEE